MTLALASRRTALTPPWVRNDLWRRARAVPSLDLRFADNKSLVDAVTGASLVTFTRASDGTFTDSAGVLQTASTDVPRFDHNPITGESLGLLVEEQRTNLLQRSEEFDDAAWSKVAATVTADAINSPNGQQNADKLVETTAASTGHFVNPLPNPSITSGQSYTYSVFAKAAERTFLQLILTGIGSGGANLAAGFDLSDGTAGTPSAGSSFITAFGNGWYRCSLSITASTTASTLAQIRLSQNSSSTPSSYTGDGTSGLFIWGAQLEAGAFPTSYILNVDTAAGVTRSADVASITGSAFSGWYRQDEGTVFAEGTLLATTTGPVFVMRDPTAINRHQIVLNSAAIVTANVVESSFGVTYTAQTKSSLAYALNNAAFANNLTALQTDTSCLMPTGVIAATIGKFDFGGGQSHNGHIKRICFWPKRLANATLQTLTQ